METSKLDTCPRGPQAERAAESLPLASNSLSVPRRLQVTAWLQSEEGLGDSSGLEDGL